MYNSGTKEIISMITYKTTVKMHDTDAAGILFFGNQFRMVHEAYEVVLETIGMSFADILRKTHFFVPIVHAEADYKLPLLVGDKLTITVRLTKIGKTSFSFDYKIYNQKKNLVGTAKTIHVSVNNRTHKKIPLPPALRRKLETLL